MKRPRRSERGAWRDVDSVVLAAGLAVLGHFAGSIFFVLKQIAGQMP